MHQSLTTGSSLGHYTILERLGAGGMGEVYKALDTKLERHVAIKILPPELVASEERLRRFVQEAKAASALNHPNIITIHEIGSSESGSEPDAAPIHYISMELVEGTTLREKIYAEKRDLREVLSLLAQAAEGLARAHSTGIIHRDLKPDNVMITRDGFAKVLDFGLAKLSERSDRDDGAAEAQTAVREKTREGVIVGTVGYMSPEQVGAKNIDARSDIFSFGCILYEAITRKRPFQADSDIDTLHLILHNDPQPVTELAPDVPAELRRIVRRCLAKDPDKRIQSMKDLAIELRDLVDDYHELGRSSTSGSSPGIAAPQREVSKRSWLVGAIIAGVLLVLAVAVILRPAREQSSPAPVATMQLAPLTTNGRVLTAAISPDGRWLVYAREDGATRSVYLKQIATGSEVQILPPSETMGVARFAFSRDGNYLYLVKAEIGNPIATLSMIPTLGGASRQILEDIDSRVTLSPEEKEMAFGRADRQAAVEHQIVVASVDGSGQRVLAMRKGKESFTANPAWSPDGKWIAVAAVSSQGGLHHIPLLISSDGKVTRPLFERWWFSINSLEWLPDGSGLVVAGEDVESGRSQVWIFSFPSGEARRVTNDLNSYSDVTVTADGKSIVAVQRDDRARVWKRDAGTMIPMTSESERYAPRAFSLAPDGSLVYQSLQSGNLEVRRLSPTGESRALTNHPKADYNARVGGDGRIYFQTERNDDAEFWSMTLDGSDQRFVAKIGIDVTLDVSPDGEWLIHNAEQSLWKIPTAGGAPVKLSDKDVESPMWSPDGRSIAGFFRLAEGERRKLAVINADGGAVREVAPLPRTAVPNFVRWTSDGNHLGFVNVVNGVGQIWLQPLDGGPPRAHLEPESGMIHDFHWSSGGALYVSRGSWTADPVLITEFR
ncbi:MAG TPA: protein kinase [Thermoanaerobaculia bacterium]|nr:protein kinase [Thermoanaerobaculia bacterium]